MDKVGPATAPSEPPSEQASGSATPVPAAAEKDDDDDDEGEGELPDKDERSIANTRRVAAGDGILELDVLVALAREVLPEPARSAYDSFQYGPETYGSRGGFKDGITGAGAGEPAYTCFTPLFKLTLGECGRYVANRRELRADSQFQITCSFCLDQRQSSRSCSPRRRPESLQRACRGRVSLPVTICQSAARLRGRESVISRPACLDRQNASALVSNYTIPSRRRIDTNLARSPADPHEAEAHLNPTPHGVQNDHAGAARLAHRRVESHHARTPQHDHVRAPGVLELEARLFAQDAHDVLARPRLEVEHREAGADHACGVLGCQVEGGHVVCEERVPPGRGGEDAHARAQLGGEEERRFEDGNDGRGRELPECVG